jgi:DNA (cytosine-5)-methyltransferase 1
MTPITYGSVCSGIEAASVAWHPLLWRAAWLAEIEPFPSAVLAHHYPDVPNLGDMTRIAQRVISGEVPAPDVLVGGTPCQAFSVAGLRNSLADERGNLTLKYVELADAIDHVRRRAGQPETVITWENVPGVLSTSDNAFGCFLGALAGSGGELQPAGKRWSDAGCVYGPKRTVAWRILDAQYFGLAQRRRRVFVVASARGGFDPAAVLLERDSVRRDFAPSRQAREAVASSLAASAGHHGHSIPRGDGSDNLVASHIAPALTSNPYGDHESREGLLVAETLRGHPRPGSNSLGALTIHNTELMCVAHGQAGADMGADMAPTLSCNHEAPYIAFDSRQDTCSSEHVFGALGSSSPQAQAIAFAENSRAEIRLEGGRGDRTGALSTGGGKAGQGTPMVAYSTKLHNTSANGAGKFYEEYTVGLDVNSPPPALVSTMAVRRLTPRECERLQGFPDDYTLVPFGKVVRPEKLTEDWIKYLMRGGVMTREECARAAADSHRYKSLGNSMAVNVMRWIGYRINAQLEATS